jgi:hypothetical protein
MRAASIDSLSSCTLQFSAIHQILQKQRAPRSAAEHR